MYTVEGIRNVIKMAAMIAGSPEALRQRPFISMVTCIISPFKLDEAYGRLAIEVARNGIPLVVPAGHYVSSRHTRRHMRTEQYKPALSDRENRDVWLAAVRTGEALMGRDRHFRRYTCALRQPL